ncbi:MAG: HNH endonuclease [Planctomycetes bacterium]|nr:HNH endonuclease [Planctomycetota bacterium]
MRLAVLNRDCFRCVRCGRSPATHANVALHLDHTIPYSRRGKTTADNLRTLCEDCNWGKGNDTQVDTQGK